ncbi:MAG: hypothetical protein ACJ73S_21395 [Mycobacteriales bacterium]
MKTPTTTVAVLVAGLALLAGTGAVADTPQAGPVAPSTPLGLDDPPGRSPTGVAPVARQALPPTATVTLATGDRVRLDTTSDGRQAVVLADPDPATADTLVRFSWQGDEYAVPATAVPYLSGTLDPRLFDVSYLVRAGLDDAHSATLPLAVTGTAGGAALPTVIAASSLAKAQASQFGQLLAGNWRAATLPGVSKVSLAPPAGAPALPAAPPRSASAVKPASTGLHYHTLTLKFVNLNGDPGTALGWLQNVDDASLGATLFGTFPGGDAGPVSFSVPDGNYNLAFSVVTPHATDARHDVALVVKPQVKVGSDLTVTLDARTAVQYRTTIDPAVAPTLQVDRLDLTRASATGGQVGTAGIIGVLMGLLSASLPGLTPSPTDRLLVTPTSTVTKGTLGWDATSVLYTNSPPGTPSTSSRYALSFAHAGSIPATQTHAVPAADLTTVHHHLYASFGAESCSGFPRELFRFVYQPWGGYQELGYANYDAVPTGDVTDYWYSAEPAVDVWQVAFNNSSDCTRRWSERRTISHGQQLTETFNKAPLVPSTTVTYANQPVLFGGITAPRAAVCAACRQDDNGMLHLQPFGDSDLTHYTDPTWAKNSRIRFSRDGTLALSSDGTYWGTLAPQALALPLLPGPATYQLDWSWSAQHQTASVTDTTWTFRSGPTDPAASLPTDVRCAPDGTRSCSYLPLLFVGYDLALSLDSTAPAGADFPIAFTVAAQRGAPAPTGVTATVAASFDDGKTWTDPGPAQAGADGRFTATITHPDLAATSGAVSLRVTARDGAGNSVVQTIIRAYGLTS